MPNQGLRPKHWIGGLNSASTYPNLSANDLGAKVGYSSIAAKDLGVGDLGAGFRYLGLCTNTKLGPTLRDLDLAFEDTSLATEELVLTSMDRSLGAEHKGIIVRDP